MGGVSDFFDEFINRYDAVSASVTILIITIILIIIVLGKEFWLNLFGLLGSPSITFQRMIGEISLPPAIFVVVISGFFMAITLLLAWTDAVTGDAVQARFNIFFDWMSEKVVTMSGVVPEQLNIRGWFAHVEQDVAYLLAFFVLIPVGCLIVWAVGAIGFHLASLFSGYKCGGSIGGLLAASSYIYLPTVMLVLFLIKFIYAGWFNTSLLVLFGLYFIFLWTLLMREYGRYAHLKGLTSFVIGFILTAILTVVVVLAILWIIALIIQYT